MININSSSRYIINKKNIVETADNIIKADYKINPPYSLNISFVGTRKIKNIAKKCKKHPDAYPVLTFSYLSDAPGNQDEEGVLIGDIIICYPSAVLLASEKDKTVNEIINYLIDHGLDNI